MTKPGNLGTVSIRRKEDVNVIVGNFEKLLKTFHSIETENDLKAMLSLIILCLIHFKKINQKNLDTVISHYKDDEDLGWAKWFELDVDADTVEQLFDNLDKKTLYSFYNKELTKPLRTALKQFSENHFEMEKTTKQGKRVGMKLLYATLNGNDRRITPAKLHYRGFADVSQSKKSGKAASKLAKTIFR